jgi:hypothetical protein
MRSEPQWNAPVDEPREQAAVRLGADGCSAVDVLGRPPRRPSCSAVSQYRRYRRRWAGIIAAILGYPIGCARSVRSVRNVRTSGASVAGSTGASRPDVEAAPEPSIGPCRASPASRRCRVRAVRRGSAGTPLPLGRRSGAPTTRQLCRGRTEPRLQGDGGDRLPALDVAAARRHLRRSRTPTSTLGAVRSQRGREPSRIRRPVWACTASISVALPAPASPDTSTERGEPPSASLNQPRSAACSVNRLTTAPSTPTPLPDAGVRARAGSAPCSGHAVACLRPGRFASARIIRRSREHTRVVRMSRAT